LEAAQIWRELAPHHFPVDCFGDSSDLAGTGSTLFSGRLFLEAAQIWLELAPHYFLADCFGGGSHLLGTGSTLFTGPHVNAGIFLPGYIPQGIMADGLSTRV
jgi:hypothetical protein